MCSFSMNTQLGVNEADGDDDESRSTCFSLPIIDRDVGFIYLLVVYGEGMLPKGGLSMLV